MMLPCFHSEKQLASCICVVAVQGLLQIIKDHHESMFELKQQANGGNGGVREVVVGWFCTGSEMTELTCAVHGWFKQFSSVSKFFPQPPLTEPIHLMVDAVMESGSFSVKVRFPAGCEDWGCCVGCGGCAGCGPMTSRISSSTPAKMEKNLLMS